MVDTIVFFVRNVTLFLPKMSGFTIVYFGLAIGYLFAVWTIESHFIYTGAKINIISFDC